MAVSAAQRPMPSSTQSPGRAYPAGCWPRYPLASDAREGVYVPKPGKQGTPAKPLFLVPGPPKQPWARGLVPGMQRGLSVGAAFQRTTE